MKTLQCLIPREMCGEDEWVPLELGKAAPMTHLLPETTAMVLVLQCEVTLLLG